MKNASIEIMLKSYLNFFFMFIFRNHQSENKSCQLFEIFIFLLGKNLCKSVIYDTYLTDLSLTAQVIFEFKNMTTFETCFILKTFEYLFLFFTFVSNGKRPKKKKRKKNRKKLKTQRKN